MSEFHSVASLRANLSSHQPRTFLPRRIRRWFARFLPSWYAYPTGVGSKVESCRNRDFDPVQSRKRHAAINSTNTILRTGEHHRSHNDAIGRAYRRFREYSLVPTDRESHDERPFASLTILPVPPQPVLNAKLLLLLETGATNVLLDLFVDSSQHALHLAFSRRRHQRAPRFFFPCLLTVNKTLS